MSGIVGVCGLEDKNLLKRMGDVVFHRGPDGFKIFSDRKIGLGHRHLIIKNPEEKKQPAHNEDESIWAVLDGQIYNYPELKRDLENRGHKLRSSCNAEVISHMYEEYGDFFVRKLNGMFAIAIWDRSNKKLLLARDRIGIKPLHYTVLGDVLLFGSEIKSVLQYEEVPHRVNLQSLFNFLNFNYIPGKETMLEGIRRLRPGHVLTFKNREIIDRRYWDLKVDVSPGKSEAFYAKRLLELLTESVKKTMISGVSPGVPLSGGLDSSTIVALASKFAEEPIKTYTAGFGEPTDELPDARIVADYFETDHHELRIEPSALRLLPKAIWHMDEPKRSITPAYLLYEFIRKDTPLVLEGLGGDEMFSGYRAHRYMYMSESLSKATPGFVRTKLIPPIAKMFPRTSELRRGLKYLQTLKDKGKNYATILSTAKMFINRGYP